MALDWPIIRAALGIEVDKLGLEEAEARQRFENAKSASIAKASEIFETIPNAVEIAPFNSFTDRSKAERAQFLLQGFLINGVERSICQPIRNVFTTLEKFDKLKKPPIELLNRFNAISGGIS